MGIELTPKQLAMVERQVVNGVDARRLNDNQKVPCSTCGSDSTVFAERRNQIIKEAMSWFETPGSGSDLHVAVRFIAALVEQVKLQNAIESRVRDAESAKRKLHGDQTADV